MTDKIGYNKINEHEMLAQFMLLYGDYSNRGSDKDAPWENKKFNKLMIDITQYIHKVKVKKNEIEEKRSTYNNTLDDYKQMSIDYMRICKLLQEDEKGRIFERLFLDNSPIYEVENSYSSFKNSLDNYLDKEKLHNHLYQQWSDKSMNLSDVVRQMYLQSKNKNSPSFQTMYVLEQFLLLDKKVIDKEQYEKTFKYLDKIQKNNGSTKVFNIIELIIKSLNNNNQEFKDALSNYTINSIIDNSDKAYLLSLLNKDKKDLDLNFIIADFNKIKDFLSNDKGIDERVVFQIDDILDSIKYLINNKDYYQNADYISLKNSFYFLDQLTKKVLISKNFSIDAKNEFSLNLQELLSECQYFLGQQKAVVEKEVLKEIKTEKLYFKSMNAR